MKESAHGEFLRITRETFDPSQSFWWRSRELRAKPVTEPSRALEIIRRVCEPESRLLTEMHEGLGDIISQMLVPSFWDRYFRAYDSLVSLNVPYRGLMQLAHEHLPRKGRILDLGAGTGNFSLLLALGSSERSFALVDQSPTGIALAKTKFIARFGASGVDLKTKVRSLLDKRKFWRADGAVLNNVLYSIPTLEGKFALLRRIARSLSPKGRLFLNDPLPTASESAFYRDCFTHLALGAVTEGTPLTEFDLVILTAANLRLTRSEGKPDQSLFLGVPEIRKLCELAGFRLLSTSPSYVGISQAYFLEVRSQT